MVIVDQDAGGEVDAALVRLARSRGAANITGDLNLAKVAEARRRAGPIASRAGGGEALRHAMLPGERLTVRLPKEGLTNPLQTTGRMVFARPEGR